MIDSWLEGKRETGVSPVRSRHCVAELFLRCHWEVPGKVEKALMLSQETCLIAWYIRSRGIGRADIGSRNAPVFLVCLIS